ncbi:N-acetylmuramic acid 6-phosphate etherase [Aliiroseovarius sp. KMU-50]|uniref:N-acetylmuramic acid 6-phosphate etherase n=1 Tax=Aliiroseovarius salicola TaxID=3009082 RepID=A0ABT4W1W5_9RHOB|nr:N-acetylmuramic acid 6-phosphate etherase [Aliiroseovarius sp. KMU-50]MDA5094513.1 N-acetylmuramic acid 6-phosphate etherase [Aliiroseovarius sp. KMU-50]
MNKMAVEPVKTTEELHDKASGLDRLPAEMVAAVLAEGQHQAALAVQQSITPIAEASHAMADTIRTGGALYYVAAGSSGLMAAADAMELGGTFSIPASQIRILMAGGIPTTPEMPGDTEDDSDALDHTLSGLTGRDTVITVSASGTTPYTLAAAQIAKARGATLIGIANNKGAPLLLQSDYAICLPTPAEVLSGSTRMGAGTAQKIALNMLSTLMAVDLGHVYDGMMVNLRADNAKLRSRAAGIVARIAQVDEAAAHEALSQTDGHTKLAVLVALGASPKQAEDILKETGGHLRPAMSALWP